MSFRGKPFWIIDCETDPFEFDRFPCPFLWGLYTGEDYFEFETAQAVVDFVCDKNVIIYAHNGGKFDYFFMTDFFEDGPVLQINGRLAKFRIGECEFRDSWNILPVRLAAYQKTEIDYGKFERKVRHKHMREIRSYLRDDCVNLYELVDAFTDEYGRHITQASAAMKIWAKMSGESPPNSSPYFYDEFKPYYFGGRVQCFESGKILRPTKSYDINSAYPFAMLHNHPISVDSVECKSLPANTPIGPCMFKVRCLSEGALPYRTDNFATYYPDWRIEGKIHRTYNITGWELQAALDTKTIHNPEILSCTYFHRTTNFSDYVNRFWKLKKDASDRLKINPENRIAKSDRECAKLFLNGLYGKFGADPRAYTNCEYHTDRGFLNECVLNGVSFGEFGKGMFTYDKSNEEFHRFFNVATAASVTGFVRAYMWRHIIKAGGLVYCDTDSITASGFTGFDTGDELGQWECEGEYDKLLVGGKKLYAFHHAGKPKAIENWKVASKGVRLTPLEIEKIVEGERITYNPVVPTYSTKRPKPIFIPRSVTATASDIRIVPPEIDPENMLSLTA